MNIEYRTRNIECRRMVRRRRLKYVRRTPLRLEFGIWDLEFPGQASSFLVPACPGCGQVSYFPFS